VTSDPSPGDVSHDHEEAGGVIDAAEDTDEAGDSDDAADHADAPDEPGDAPPIDGHAPPSSDLDAAEGRNPDR
jgi:hypothetical protein